jgi:hypothetical protein
MRGATTGLPSSTSPDPVQPMPHQVDWQGEGGRASSRHGHTGLPLAEAGGIRQRRDVDLDNSGSVFASPGRSERSGDASRSTPRTRPEPGL